MLSPERIGQIEVDQDLLLDSMESHKIVCDICIKGQNCVDMWLLYEKYALNTEKLDKPGSFRN